MTQPGRRLRAFAARICSPQTMDRLIDPVIGDLGAEYGEAVRQGATWRARGVRIAGVVAFAKVLLWAGLARCSDALGSWTTSEATLLRKSSQWFVAATVASTLLLLTPQYANGMLLMAYLVPSVLPVTVAIGVAFAVLCTSDRERLTHKLLAVFVAGSLVCSMAMLGNVVWVLPESNQAFRETAFGGPVPRGDREMSMSELERLGKLRPDQARRFEITYHTRRAIAAAPLALMIISLPLVPVRRKRRFTGAPTAALVCAAYWFLLLVVQQLGIWSMLPPILTVWTPNLVFALVAVGLAWRHHTARTPRHA